MVFPMGLSLGRFPPAGYRIRRKRSRRSFPAREPRAPRANAVTGGASGDDVCPIGGFYSCRKRAASVWLSVSNVFKGVTSNPWLLART